MRRSPSVSALASAVLVAAVAWAGPLRGQTIVAGPTTTELAAVAGDRITVPIGIDMTGASGITLGAYRARFSWTPGVFNLVSATGGAFGSPVFNTDSAANGVVRFAAASAAGANGVFVIGNLTLEVAAEVSATLRVAFEELTAASSFQDLLPFLTVVQGSFCGSGVWGDLTGDGMVGSVDAQAVLMHSVGLAVADTAAGDVDVNGVVDPRDALIILSYVVGLDVTQFRVGQLVSATCSPGEPDTVTVLPTPVSMAPGDVVRLAATVRDTAGLLLGGKNLAWASSDAAVATVDSTGAVTAVAQGSATITAAVAPGITGGATVTVGPRRRWIVDPAGAQGQVAELGSSLYPFSTIATAIQRAAPGDTVFLTLATYNEPLTASKALVFDGDSSASGMPTISTPNQPLGAIDGTGGKVTVRRIQFSNAAGGLSIRADTLEMASLSFATIAGAPVWAVGPQRATLDGVRVSGAINGGIAIDSAGVVSVVRSRVAGVEAVDSDSAFGFGVRADSASFDLVEVDAVQGVGISTVGTARTLVRRSTIRNTSDVGIFADTAGTLEVRDGVRLEQIGAGAVGGMVDTLRMVNDTISQVNGVAVFLNDRAYTYLEMLGVDISGAGAGATALFGGASALIRRTSIADAVSGIDVDATNLTVDTVTLRGIDQYGIWQSGGAMTIVNASTLEDVGRIGGYAIQDPSTGAGYMAITGTRVSGVENGVGVYFLGDSLLIQDDTITGIGGESYGVYHYQSTVATPGTWTRVRNTLVDNTDDLGIYTYGVELVDVAGLTMTRTNRGNSGSYWGFRADGFDSLRVDSSAFRDNVGGAIYAYNGRIAAIQDDTLERNFGGRLAGSGYASAALYLYSVGRLTATGSRFIDNLGGGIQFYAYSASGGTATVEGNVFRGAYQGVQAEGADSLTGRFDVRNNTFVGRMGDGYTAQVDVRSFGRVAAENNTIDSTVAYAVDLQSADSIIVTGNTITNLDGNYPGVYAGAGAASIENNTISCAGTYRGSAIQQDHGSATIQGNTVLNCDAGVWAYNGEFSSGIVDTVVIRNNTLVGDTVALGPGIGILLNDGLQRAEIVGNAVRRFMSSGVFVTAFSASYRNSMVRVDSNDVRDNRREGISVTQVDTAYVRGDTVTGTLPQAGYADSVGVLLDNVDSAEVFTNRIASNAGNGIWLGPSALGVRLDTNLIADNTDNGVVLNALATGTLNSIRRNANSGIYDAVGTGSTFQANNIEGNGYGVYNVGTTAIDVANSWWGDLSGPACATCAGLGDSVSVNVAYDPFAADTIVGAPVGAPPATLVVRAAPTVLRTQSSPVFAPAGRTADAVASTERLRRPAPIENPAVAVPAPTLRPRVDRHGNIEGVTLPARARPGGNQQ